jgi:RHS repeat-associated protein
MLLSNARLTSEREAARLRGPPTAHPAGGSAANFSQGGAPRKFTGKEEDSEVGLTYFGKRFLNAQLGRWISADPLAVHAPGEADLNLYAYVSGSVLKNVDPLGLEEKSTDSKNEHAKQEDLSGIFQNTVSYLEQLGVPAGVLQRAAMDVENGKLRLAIGNSACGGEGEAVGCYSTSEDGTPTLSMSQRSWDLLKTFTTAGHKLSEGDRHDLVEVAIGTLAHEAAHHENATRGATNLRSAAVESLLEQASGKLNLQAEVSGAEVHGLLDISNAVDYADEMIAEATERVIKGRTSYALNQRWGLGGQTREQAEKYTNLKLQKGAGVLNMTIGKANVGLRDTSHTLGAEAIKAVRAILEPVVLKGEAE